ASSAPPVAAAPQAPPAPSAPPSAPAAAATTAPAAAERKDESPGGGRVFATPRARMRAEEHEVELSELQGTGPEGLIIELDVLEAVKNAPKASSLARKVAQQRGLSLDGIAGTGPQGRILRDDVLSSAGPSAAAGEPPSSMVPGDASGLSGRTVPISGMRRVIARRMRESLDTAAQAVHRIEVDMTEAGRMRAKLKDLEIKVSYNDVVIKAVASALREHPRMNATMTENEIIEFSDINIGMAVAVEEGLLVPVLQAVDRMGLKEIHAESRRLGELARDGSLGTEDMQGGTFSVSNLGMFEIDSFTAVINSPESGILAVGAVKDRVVPVDGEAVIRPIAELSLTYDHRIIDGAPAASFLRTVKTLLENPYLLI
ncbi:MAG: 2-oxo acid dehydrogenase subunit E2, partial [Spirochaeta sp.]|nr:2-oxo acid dehydrogenase subunit E2 [Spirochaeta sp.]